MHLICHDGHDWSRPFLFYRSCVVVMDFNRHMRSPNVQAFASKVLTLYEEEEEDRAPLHGYRRICAVQFLHFIPLQRNILHCATINCSEKTSLRAGVT